MKSNIEKYFAIAFFFALYFIISCNTYVDANPNFYLSANNISRDSINNIIKAQGNVEIQTKDIKLKADNLEYDLKKEIVKVSGNIQISTYDGNTIFAKNAVLNNNLKYGSIKSLGVLMADKSRLAANSAVSISEKNRTVYNGIVYTKCELCENKDSDLLWKIKAKKATHLKNSKVIVYENVFLEAFNIPVVYVPVFYHPDPTVKRKTGLLAPKISSSNIFGYSYRQPVYINLSKQSDIEVIPTITTKEGGIFETKYRNKYNSGELEFETSITKGSKVRENEPTKKEVRGHIDLGYAQSIKKDWTLGANIKRASDKSYLSRYKFSSGGNILTQNIFLEKGNIFNNFSTEAIKFQTLSDDYTASNLPFIRPKVTLDWNNLNNSKRDRNFNTSLTARSISKGNNIYTDSLNINNDSERKYLVNGFLIKDHYSLDFDFYRSNSINEVDKNTLRLMPEFGLQASFPLFRSKKGSISIFEPLAQFYFSEHDNKNNHIKNEDSQEVDLTSTNIFENNRYSGLDRRENGFRANYGFQNRLQLENNTNFFSTLGRTYHSKEQEGFLETKGFKNKNSEIVGNIYITKNSDTEFYYDFRLSEELELKKNRIKTNFDFLKTNFDLAYIQLRDFPSSNNSSTEQMSFTVKRKIFSNWEFIISQFRDLAGAKYSTPIKSTLGLNFLHQCAKISINLSKDKSNDIDIPASTNLSFTVDLFGN